MEPLIKLLIAVYRASLVVYSLLATSLTIYYAIQKAQGISTHYNFIAALLLAVICVTLIILEDT
jgi:hypothetical protein